MSYDGHLPHRWSSLTPGSPSGQGAAESGLTTASSSHDKAQAPCPPQQSIAVEKEKLFPSRLGEETAQAESTRVVEYVGAPAFLLTLLVTCSWLRGLATCKQRQQRYPKKQNDRHPQKEGADGDDE